MEMNITEQAWLQMEQRKGEENGYFKLKYETEGCGCVVCGVMELWFVDEMDEGDIAVETNKVPVLIEKSKAIFLNDRVMIDYSTANHCFQLKSPDEYLNPVMRFVNKVTQVQK